MNLAYYLTPKNDVAFLYDDYTLRQGLEKMRYHRYSIIPVITRDGKYVSTISEGDFLWHLLCREEESGTLRQMNMKEVENQNICTVERKTAYRPVNITAGWEELLEAAMQQNFVPVVDDLGSFIGIVTRRDIFRHFREQFAAAEKEK